MKTQWISGPALLVATALLLACGMQKAQSRFSLFRPERYAGRLSTRSGSPSHPATAGSGMEQRSLFRDCIYAAEQARMHLDELLKYCDSQSHSS